MSALTRLIVTADDFGYSPQVNDAVVRAHREGILGFASLLVTGEAAEDAVRRAQAECPSLGIGLHLDLCSANPARCALRYFFRAELKPALEARMRAQFERFLEFGLRPGHVDGHMNIHVHPVVFPLLMRLAREYGFSRVRLPSGELAPSLAYRLRPFLSQMAHATTFALLKTYLLRSHGDPAIEVPERTWGLLRSGLMSEEYFLWLLSRLPEGTTEIYFHPTSDPTSIPDGGPTPTHHSILELRALTSPRVKELMAERGIISLRSTMHA